MLQIAAAIWNEIAKEGMQTSLGKRLFPMTQEQQTNLLEIEADYLERQGKDPTAIRAFQQVAPLLAERSAITKYLTKHPQHVGAFPEVNNLREAVLLAAEEHRLSASQRRELEDLLKQIR